MKRKLFKIFVTIFIFLLPCINVNAYNENYSYKNAYIDISSLTNGSSTWYITSNKTHTATKIGSSYGFWVHQAYKENEYIHAYCLNVGKTANTNLCTSLLDKKFTADNTGLSSNKVKLLKELLANATYHSGDIGNTGSNYNKNDKYKIIATQILVWEVVEGARDNFNSIQPNKYNKDNSAYKKFVKQNTSVKTAYENIIKKIQNNTTPSSTSGTIFESGSAYILPWNGSKYTKTLGNVGDYTTCTSSNSKVSVKVSSNKLTVSSNSELTSDVTITCSHTVGSTKGVNKDEYHYYKFTCAGNYQDLIRGETFYTYSQSVKVKTAKRNVKIIKYDENNKELTGAKFTLTSGSTAYTYDLTGASNKTISLNKSGNYILSETTVPNGKQKMPDATISIDVENGTAKLVSGGGGLVSISNGDTITISIRNTSKYFSVNKRDSSGNAVKGATFQIKNSSGSIMKFNWNGLMFVYNASGTTTNIVNANSNAYPISGLPDGDYSLVEVAVPAPYVLAGTESERTVKFRIKNGEMYLYSTSSKNYLATSSSSIIMTNYTTKVIINKIGYSGVKLSNISFYLWDSTKTKKIKSTMTSSGLYSYNTDQNTGTESYTTNANGQIIVSSLPAGIYYFEEYSTGDSNYPVPEGEEAFTKIEIVVSSSGVKVNNDSSGQVTISNAKNQFSFYKVDENGNYLTGGIFKIQRYDSKTKSYIDMSIAKTTSENVTGDVYKPDSNSNTYTFKVNNGVTTFIDMTPSTKYRIVELEAPEGYMMSNVEGEDKLVIEISSGGYVKSSTTLVNKKVTVGEDAQASAEFIVNISTGQTRIRYILIISILLIIIISLFIINRKIRKK